MLAIVGLVLFWVSESGNIPVLTYNHDVHDNTSDSE